ncbi:MULTISPECIES: CDP-diacylglycerol--serine O-phosphatidyltransferase [Bacillales]|jgi:CDP-diacylglycerol---serine O-phosphatidyltransferase|uniref:CDP-diacylglycerol--serine O-phosphatidyltransferase n=1 Tax=Bacillales TaxID=1385 RepID=UPI0010F4B02D|nr:MULTISPECIES: CDP-diacylglycerol--serine O-phosphatidyltransferase [Bacillaceae]MBH0156705.1 CDP-diacylglycerol--serine O-phosphatidyltransferase [Fictibacillus sp. 5RED26]MBH0161799.1 CDP-diacylglycerol--serine O-phosphatidyltransferase [Fictibacillus sp. 26RED30]MBH0164175.1 CDP-diacylglycerol--serine O-phosphatidyltransferase [Fictibacillus sp. 7GRE50]MBH0173697.1 CDP-diacylglycerol--serine O-phosphatidyltransferase [Fictibacillus sp. 23RED33]
MKKHIPNLLTLGNLFCGFLSIGYVSNGDIRNAAILIFIAMMLDAVDGRAARILGVSGNLGKELDSLADVVSFGVAPAYFVANTYFAHLGMWGFLFAGLFPLFGAYRLARFNITAAEESMKYFKGIPIPLAGGIVVFLVFFVKWIPLWIFVLLFYGLGLLMVSTIKIPSFKDIPMPRYGTIISLFLFYMFYLLAKNRFESVPIFFYVALATYFLFIGVRFIKVKEIKIRRPRRPRRNKRRRF